MKKRIFYWILFGLLITAGTMVLVVYFGKNSIDAHHKKELHELKSKAKIFIDYSKPSFRKRLWLLDGDSILLNTYVTHGKNSGLIYARKFSNTENSLMSCIGEFRTSDIYYGDHGLSMRLIGLDSTNSNAFKRDIVFHSAEYATKNYLLTNGYLGRSHGCFATSPEDNKFIIDFVRKNGPISVVVRK